MNTELLYPVQDDTLESDNQYHQLLSLLTHCNRQHSRQAASRLKLKSGDRVLDVGAGSGEFALEAASKVGTNGAVTAIEQCPILHTIARAHQASGAVTGIEFLPGNTRTSHLPEAHFDAALAHFSLLYSGNIPAELQAIQRALKPGGRLTLITWRNARDNPCWRLSQEVAEYHLPHAGNDPTEQPYTDYQLADPAVAQRLLEEAGFPQVHQIERQDIEICIGTTIAEAVDYQMKVGPCAERIRRSGQQGQLKLGLIAQQLQAVFRDLVRNDGSVWLPSSSWLISTRKS